MQGCAGLLDFIFIFSRRASPFEVIILLAELLSKAGKYKPSRVSIEVITWSASPVGSLLVLLSVNKEKLGPNCIHVA